MNTEPDSESTAGPSNELGTEADLKAGFDKIPLPARVHQAAGMVAFHLELTIQDAYQWLQTYARSSGRDLDAVASDVIDRRLRIDPERE